jgi:hypothetical protein
MSKLVNIFAAGGASLLLAGCVTNQMSGECMGGTSLGVLFSYRSFDRDCADSKAARTMLASPRKDMQLVGATALRNQSPDMDKAFRDVQNGKGASAPVKTAKTCTVTQVAGEKRKDGTVAHLDCNI